MCWFHGFTARVRTQARGTLDFSSFVPLLTSGPPMDSGTTQKVTATKLTKLGYLGKKP